MKLTVLGATGGIGQQVVRQAVADGDQVTAVVRDPGRLLVPAGPALDVARADVFDPAQLAPLIVGRDAVISALGVRRGDSATVCTDSARALVTAAREAGVRRILLVSASGAFVERKDDPLTRYVVKPLLGRFLATPFADTRAMESVIRASGLDWTLVRPPKLDDKPHTGRYRTGRDGVRGGYTVSRADVADALLTLASQPDAVGATITVAR